MCIMDSGAGTEFVTRTHSQKMADALFGKNLEQVATYRKLCQVEKTGYSLLSDVVRDKYSYSG